MRTVPAMEFAPDHPVGRKSLIAVFDESGGESNVPGEGSGADFAVAAIVFQGRRPFRDLVQLDERLRLILGKQDYKYRQVRQSSEAREAVINALRTQSGMIRVFAYYAAGGAFVEQAKKELIAVQQMDSGAAAISDAQDKLKRHLSDPRREGLRDAMDTSLPAMSTWAGARSRRIDVYFDRRSDLVSLCRDLDEAMKLWHKSGLYGSAYSNMDWRGECVSDLDPVARIADVFAGDFRATMRRHGGAIWSQVESDGFVGRHTEAWRYPQPDVDNLVPVPMIGVVADSVWDEHWSEGSTETTMFSAYIDYLLKRRTTLYSPCGRGLLVLRSQSGFDLFQVLD